MKTIYLASGNAHKLHELQTALNLAGLPLRVAGPDEIGGMPEVEETGSTFETNALLKAHGLKVDGSHGGNEEQELRTFMFAYQKKPFPMKQIYN